MRQSFGTKAETLSCLAEQGFPVPPSYFFEARQWRSDPQQVLRAIQSRFPCGSLAVRSSARCEDGNEQSLAGAFQSILHVPSQDAPQLGKAIDEVISVFRDERDQVLVQPMIGEVTMCGVAMTRALEDGSPYYVINYDDVSGRTDTVTGGTGVSKTVCIYKGVRPEYFDSPRLWRVLDMLRGLERHYGQTPLDVEFAVDSAESVHLLQVRRICAAKRWRANAGLGVSRRIRHVEAYVKEIMRPRPELFGQRTLLGIMPDWNPAEIIGVTPRPLAMSLYRELITSRIWSRARARMGYRCLPPTELMLSLAGRPYIDVRASFNSFLPADLPAPACEKLIDAWLDRLDANPALHDKVEFEIAHTVLDFDFDQSFDARYPGLLSPAQRLAFKAGLRRLTNRALMPGGTLKTALADAQALERKQRALMPPRPTAASGFALAATLSPLLEECRELGTLPFSIAARHAFMAESLLRSAVRRGALSQERLQAFKCSVRTVSGELSRDFRAACQSGEARRAFLCQYGHLRPGTYDIMTPCYAQRADLFEIADLPESRQDPPRFSLRAAESNALAALLDEAGLDCAPEHLLKYARTAIAGREWIKFVFSRHICAVLENLAAWGQTLELTREQLSMLNVDMVINGLYAPLPAEARTYYLKLIEAQRQGYELAHSFRLSHLIRSPRDVYVAAQQRSVPNFITSQRLEAPVIHLTGSGAGLKLRGAIVCIESADPGYDWLFTRGIAGLVTRYGGANSHMAIRCAEYNLPAAIGCGGILFERISKARSGLLDCAGKLIMPLHEDN